MRRILAVLLVFAFVGTAGAQTASQWSFGPALPFYTIGWDSTGDARTEFFGAGAGVSFDRNFFPTMDGSLRMLTVGIPLFVSAVDTDHLNLAAGLTFGTFNNLIAVGVAVNLASVVDGPGDSGLFVDPGAFAKQDVKILFSFGFNIGGGSAPALNSAKASAFAMSASNDPPPCYVRMPWQDK